MNCASCGADVPASKPKRTKIPPLSQAQRLELRELCADSQPVIPIDGNHKRVLLALQRKDLVDVSECGWKLTDLGRAVADEVEAHKHRLDARASRA